MKINAQIFFPILLINLNLIFSLKYIIIPFQVQKYDYKDDRNGLLHEYLYKDIMINLSVGTPKQSIPLLAGMGEYSTYIVSNEASDLKGKFDKELSQTYYTSEEINEIYSYQTFSEAFPSKETIYLENPETQINNYEFFLVTKIGKNICYLPYCEILTQPGVIGFKMAESETYYEKVNNTNLILQLKNKEIIDNYDFSFFFESPEKGSIIIGQKPHEYDNAHYKQENFKFTKSFIDNEKEKDWGLYFNKIYFGDSELASDKTMLLRVEYGVINGNKKWQEILEKNFFGELIKQEKCYIGKGYNDGHSYFHYYCRKDTDISTFKQFDFIINDLNINITLTKDDLFIDDGDKLLFLIVFGHPQPILGFPVFKKYQFIFNQDTNTIGLYNKIIGNPTIPKPSTRSKSDDGQKPNSYKLIVFLLFFVIVVLSIYIVRTYLHNRKMKEMRMILNERNKEIQLVSYEKFDS
jgi:hypothetical protein